MRISILGAVFMIAMCLLTQYAQNDWYWRVLALLIGLAHGFAAVILEERIRSGR